LGWGVTPPAGYKPVAALRVDPGRRVEEERVWSASAAGAGETGGGGVCGASDKA